MGDEITYPNEQTPLWEAAVHGFDPEAAAESVHIVQSYFRERGAVSPTQIGGVRESDLLGLPEDFIHKSYIRRTLAHMVALTNAAVASATTGSGSASGSWAPPGSAGAFAQPGGGVVGGSSATSPQAMHNISLNQHAAQVSTGFNLSGLQAPGTPAAASIGQSPGGPQTPSASSPGTAPPGFGVSQGLPGQPPVPLPGGAPAQFPWATGFPPAQPQVPWYYPQMPAAPSLLQMHAEQERIRMLGGSKATTQALSNALGGSTVSFDTKTRLAGAGLSNLIFYHTPADSLFQVLNQATINSRLAGQLVVFTFVDLTCPELIPPWITMEDIGGRADEIEGFVDATGHVETIARLGKALTAGLEKKRIFRSLPQWISAFMRYMCVAVTVGQLDWGLGMIHMQNMMRLYEECNASDPRAGLVLIVLYDELLRFQIASRAERKDPELCLVRSFQKLNKEVLAEAKSKLEDTLHRVGRGPRASPALPSPWAGAASQDLGTMRWQQQEVAASVSSAPHRSVDGPNPKPSVRDNGKGGGGKTAAKPSVRETEAKALGIHGKQAGETRKQFKGRIWQGKMGVAKKEKGKHPWHN